MIIFFLTRDRELSILFLITHPEHKCLSKHFISTFSFSIGKKTYLILIKDRLKIHFQDDSSFLNQNNNLIRPVTAATVWLKKGIKLIHVFVIIVMHKLLYLLISCALSHVL